MAKLNRRDYYSAIPQLEKTVTNITDHITVTDEKVQAQVEDLYGNYTTVTETVDGLTTEVHDEVEERTTLIRAFSGGTLVAYEGGNCGVYTKADGSVEIVEITSWDTDGVPTLGDTMASYSGTGITFMDTIPFTIGNGTSYMEWTGSALNLITDSLYIGNKDVADAEKVATNYLDYDATDGLTVGQASLSSKVNIKSDGVRIYDENGNVGTQVSSSGMDVNVGGTNYATFGSTARIGNPNGYNAKFGNQYLRFLYGSTIYGNLEYGSSAFTLDAATATNLILKNGTTIIDLNGSQIDCQGEIRAEDGIRNVNNKWLARYDSDSNANAFGNTNEDTIIRGDHIYRSGSGTSFNSSSDIRLKENIKPLDYASDIILNLEPFEFKWKESDKDIYDKDKHFGVSAQKVRELFKENGLDADEYALNGEHNGYFTLQYGDFIPMLIQTVQKQQAQIDVLTERINIIKEKNDD